MQTKKRRWLIAAGAAVILILCALLATTTSTTGDGGHVSNMYGTFWSLLPPIIAIVLALITKEVYTSLFVGITVGALFYANFNPELTYTTIFFGEGGMVNKLSDSWNVGILIFLVVLGIIVSLMNKAGGSAAFGQWASSHIKTRVGAQLATILLGCLIFVDDYFNCLTVGSVMRPVTDKFKVSRAKLAYLIDATAAPICIIAPISSWAAAVTSSVPEDFGGNGFALFLQTIPYNLYAILTIVMMIGLVVMKIDYGPMRTHEANAAKGDLFTTPDRPYGDGEQGEVNHKGKVIDLVLPVVMLIIFCIIGMIYTGGFFDGVNFITAFGDADASAGLVLGSVAALIFAFIFYLVRGVLTFDQFTSCIPEGFKAMTAPILILTFAWTLSGMTGMLGGAEYVGALVEGMAGGLKGFLPAVIFLIAFALAFATGTSWGTFGILIPIVCGMFPYGTPILIIGIAACLGGAVTGDHCSPISDTTIMASAGAQSNHVNHVQTQLPYAATCAVVCFVGYLLAGVINLLAPNFSQPWVILLPISILMMIGTLFVIRATIAKEPVDAK